LVALALAQRLVVGHTGTGPTEWSQRPSVTVLRVTVVQTVLVYVGIPVLIYGVIALLTLWPKFARGPRYRPGQEWTYEPVWWTANPAGVGDHHAEAPHAAAVSTDPSVKTARGGARGNW
jgi:hypothetical protein